ncbi:MAG: HlyD family efflux transporter periplasmic adaptor subunit [Anaerolineae bacterium]|nr:HlyD family efflux transporter periplasmic adaptor subunit [Anaerolineae bacterium]
MIRKKTVWIALIVLCVIAGGYWGYMRWLAPDEGVETETVMQSANVTVGDLSISAAGSGVLVARSEVNLAFSSSGTLTQRLVDAADKVQAGDILAVMDDTAARKAVAEAELQVIQAQHALATAEDEARLKVAQAQVALDGAEEILDGLVNWEPDETEVEVAKANLDSAQASYWNTAARAGLWEEQTASTRISLENAITSLADAQANYTNAMDPARDWERNIEDTREVATNSLLKAQQNLEIAEANYSLNTINTSTSDVKSAYVKLLNAQTDYDNLTMSPEEDEITAAQLVVQEKEIAVKQAELTLEEVDGGQSAAIREAALTLQKAELQLTSAQEDLEGTVLVAPFAGTITAINAEVGETVNGTVLVLADLGTPVVQFWVEESDMGSISLGNRVDIVFTALPDLTYSGEIYRVDPVLVTVGNTPAVQAWATINTNEHHVNLLGDMNVEIEIIAGEATNALLVPVQALRKIGEDQYAVFVVLDNGDLEMRFVEVGLMDYVNAEIVSGLERGEVVSLGETTVSSSQSTENATDEAAPPPGIMRIFGG